MDLGAGWCRFGGGFSRSDDGGSRGQRLFLQLLQAQLASRGRPAGRELALFFLQLLDGAQRSAVPGPDLGGPLGVGLLRSPVRDVRGGPVNGGRKLVRARGHGSLLGVPGLPEFPAAADGGLFLTH